MYKLVAIDLDGTLLSDQKTISSVNLNWLQKAADAGVIIALATGRGLPNVEPYLKEMQIDVPMVLTNGAEVWASTSELLERHFIPEEEKLRLHQLAVEKDVHYWGYSVEGIFRRKDWQEQILSYPWIKFGIRCDDLTKIHALRETVRAWDTVEVTYAEPVHMEVMAKGVTKASGIARLCKHFNLTMSDVMAIGDSQNDAALLKQAGLGIAMENAEPQIKDLADAVTLTENENGVAHAIQRFIFKIPS